MSTLISYSLSGTASIDAVLSGARWNSTAITIKFPQNPAYVGYSVSPGNFGNLDSSQQTAFVAILNRWASVANLTFTVVNEQLSADISVYWYTSVTDPTHVYGMGSPAVEAGDIQLGALNAADLSQPGSAGYFYALQAVGQALGLKAPLTSDGLYVSDTVMSAQSYSGHSSGAYPIAAGSYPSAPMLNDIAAIQHLYGPNDNALTGNLGDTIYTFDPGASMIFQTRIDGGGNDTFNFSGYTTNLSVDLRAGHWTDLGGQYATLDTGNAGAKPPGNIAIYGSEARYVIENAYGGSGNDTLIGNAADNVLRGNDGDDVLKPGAGNDTLTGGAGNDTFDFSGGEGGQKQITDFSAGDVIKLRDAVAGGAITQGDGASLTSGQVAFGTSGGSNVLRVGLDATPGADLVIALPSNVGLGNLSVSGQTISYMADMVAPSVASVAVPAIGLYGVSRSLTFTVNFDEPVTVTGTPQLAVVVGATTRYADYVSGSGSSGLVFSYAIQSGDGAGSGITVANLGLNGGTLKDAAGNAATLGLNGVGPTSEILVDTRAPSVVTAEPPYSGDYKAGDLLNFTVTFEKPVWVTGAPKLSVSIGGVRQLDFLGGSGTNQLVFRYQVANGDNANGVSIGLLSANGGAIKDEAGNDANLAIGYASGGVGVRVDALAPSIGSVSAPAAGTYKVGDALNFTVNFSEAVTVTGTPKLALTLDTGGTVDATYVGGSGTSALVFRYTVQTGDADANGVALGSSIALNGGTVKDAVGNNAVLTGVSASGLAGVKVDGVAPTLSSVSVPAAATYKVGDTLNFTVAFDEAITVTGTPKLALTLDAGGTVDATYVSGSGTSALVFRYTVQAGDADANGVTLGASIALNGGTLKDAAGNAAGLALSNVASTASVLVDGVAPTLVSATGPTAGTYKVGDALNFTVNFSEAVRVTGTPKLALTLDTGGVVDATYVSGSGTSALVFRYTVQAGNADTDGVSLGSSIALNGGTLTDAAGNAAPLTGLSVSGLSGVKVNGVGPTAQSIVRVGAAVSKAATQAFTVTFSEAVTGVDASDFVLTTTGTAGGTITGVTGSGTTYTVSVGSVSGDGTLRLDLKGSGTGIVNGLSNPIGAGFATGQSFTIDNTAPAAPTIATVAGDDTISAGEVSGLTVSGTIEAGASVALTIGGVAKTASVSGTTWTYAVTQADIDALGAGAKTIAVTATDAAGNVGATATHAVTIAAGALTPEPEPDPEPEPQTPVQSSLADLATRPASAFMSLALGSLTITPGSSKTANPTVTLADGSTAPSTAAKVQADIDAALAAFKAGAISQAVFEQRLTLAVAPTTGVAHDAYKFFTGSAPTRAGMTWLIDSADNPNDLTDGYYARFTAENRYINFAVNLGKAGEGRAGFETQYGALTFAEAVTKAYGEIIGATEAQSAGVDVAGALRYIQSQEAYFRALGGDDLGAKAAMAGYILSVGTSFHVGKYYAALEDYVVGAITAGASAQAAAPAWDLG